MNNKNRIKKKCIFSKNNKIDISYKNIELLKKYISDNGKIIPSKLTGTKLKYQHRLSKSIKIARFLALIPYTSKQIIN